MKVIFFFACLLFTSIVRPQILNVSASTDLTILSGTIFRAEGLTLTPSANFTISNNTLNKSTSIIHTSGNPYISSVYQFINNTNPYSGSVQINYADGAELNGIPESSLTLNVHNGTSWISYPVVIIRDGTNNFVQTGGLNAVNLNELTLANLANPLPLFWLSFTATKQNKTALLQWTTTQELNTRHFIPQQSRNGTDWSGIVTLPASGNSSTTNYSYVHNTPITGINYYRILQTDMDNRNSYSDFRVLRFIATGGPFTIIGNPITNDILTVQVNTATGLALYTADGKLMWQEQVNTGTKYIDISRYAKGAYLLKANSTTQKILIQ